MRYSAYNRNKGG